MTPTLLFPDAPAETKAQAAPKHRAKECDLYPPVRDWLRRNGWTVHVEIFDADIVAVKDGKLMAVELKTGFTAGLMSQLADRCRWADYVTAAVGKPYERKKRKIRGRSPFQPRSAWQYHGYGLLTVVDGKVHQQFWPRQQPDFWNRARLYRLRKLTDRPEAMEHERAGLPSCPELKQQRRQRDPGPIVIPIPRGVTA